MTSGKLLAIGVCALALIFPTLAQSGNCNLSDLFKHNTLETLIQTSLVTGDNPTAPSITVHGNHTVCLSVGPSIGKVSSISLLIDYNCTGSAQCPGEKSDGGRSTEQFDFGCTSQNKWSVNQFSNFQASRDKTPIANFETALRTDCAACFTQHPSFNGSLLPFDQVTHCVSKSTVHSCNYFMNYGRVVQL